MGKTAIKPYKNIEYKIYGYILPEVPSHEGYVKIGETTRDAKTRVYEQVGTVGLTPKILFEKLARKSDGTWFRDRELHRYLERQGIKRKDFNGKADEWFYFNGYLEKAEQLTEQFINQDYDEVQIDSEHSEYILRNEQQEAVDKTLAYYESGVEPREFLWNAKPRFGKTLTTYDFIRRIQPTNVLIVTNRPAIANSWFDDFNKFIAWQELHMKFVSETDALNGKAMTREEYYEFLDNTSYENPAQITFMSLQDLKGAKFAGGSYDKHDWVPGLDWDLLVIDEAHEGVDTVRTDIAFNQIKRKFTLHLSGTPFKALAGGKFNENQIFNWSYLDEQEAKHNWDPLQGSNPYERLPTLNMFTYQMSKMVEEEVAEGLEIDEDVNIDYAFDLNEFFRVKENGKFEYEDSVKRFLDNLSSGKFPFAKEEYRKELNHTFWLLPRVNAAKALEKLLNKHPVFKEYKVVLAAGDGRSLQDSIEEEALNYRANTRSFDRVRDAIKKHDKTITLSVGQLTTGVTIPEWTAVLMLNNIKSPSLYFQAAFRAQNPYEYEKDGQIYRKENAYIFDFSPDRTLELYDDFANNLSGTKEKTEAERKKNIKKLLNFFPVIAEDDAGEMHEIDAAEVITIPTRIKSKEVVKRGFMSNLLFANISGIFSGHSLFKEILDKIPPEKNRRLEKQRKVNVTDPMIDEDGEIDIPKEVVIGTSQDLFGEKIYAPIEEEEKEEILSTIDFVGDKEYKKVIDQVASKITGSLSDGFEKLKDNYPITKTRTEQIKKQVETTLKNTLEEKSLQTAQTIRELEEKLEIETKEAEKENNEERIQNVIDEIEKQKKEAKEQLVEELTKEVEETIQDVVKEQIEKVEEKKKKTTEDDVRDHLRGFSRTIPAFLMAYGDENTTLANFEENIDDATFEELTSITKDEFRKLRDGFEYVTDEGETKKVPGLFNEFVFNASIREFMDTKDRLANYFDESLKEDIFDYIPPQKTNQIFTPRNVVVKMIDLLENENQNIFKGKNIKFIDLYAKSGLYLTEIVKRLNKGLAEEIPDQNERIKWILENQVYACAPSNIIYNIVKNFVIGDFKELKHNIIEYDLIEDVKNNHIGEKLLKVFGDDSLKFDVIIGNPPYQEEDGGAQASARPIYQHFVRLSKELNPDLISLIIPTRWYTGGKGLDEFRDEMLNDRHIRELHDWLTPENVFPNTNIRGGVCYFLWDKNYDNSTDLTKVVTYKNNKIINDIERPFKIENVNIFVRDSNALSILNKINITERKSLSDEISARNPFGFSTNFVNDIRFKNESSTLKEPIKCYANKGIIGYVEKQEIKKNEHWINKWKVLTPYSNNIGTELKDDNLNTIVASPNTICTETYLVIGPDLELNEDSAKALSKYMKTKFVRYLHSLAKNSQHGTRNTYRFVPIEDFTNYSEISWSNSIKNIDKQLYKKYGLSVEEINHIENSIKPMIY